MGLAGLTWAQPSLTDFSTSFASKTVHRVKEWIFKNLHILELEGTSVMIQGIIPSFADEETNTRVPNWCFPKSLEQEHTLNPTRVAPGSLLFLNNAKS